jgi:hypothetical protein
LRIQRDRPDYEYTFRRETRLGLTSVSKVIHPGLNPKISGLLWKLEEQEIRTLLSEAKMGSLVRLAAEEMGSLLSVKMGIGGDKFILSSSVSRDDPSTDDIRIIKNHI